MLDYRAHKLYVLICFPFRVVNDVSLIGVVFAAVLIAQSTSYSLPVRIVIAFVAVVAIDMTLIWVLWKPLGRAIQRVFFWLIDVVPAHGADADEAKSIVLLGPSFELNKKFEKPC